MHTVVLFHGCSTIDPDGPNDEAFHNLPWFGLGLQHYTLQEIIESPWVRERARIRHKDGIYVPGMVDRGRHFVLAFKENTIECIASSYELVGSFETVRMAEAEAMRLLQAEA